MLTQFTGTVSFICTIQKWETNHFLAMMLSQQESILDIPETCQIQKLEA